jgi:signal transduction histidine kinase
MAAFVVGRQRILFRAARAELESERFAPSPRVILLAERAPLAIASMHVVITAMIGWAFESSWCLITAIATLGLAPSASMISFPIESWISRLPLRELPMGSSRVHAFELGVRAAAPVLGFSLLALEVLPSLSVWLVFVPACVLAALEGRSAIEVRRELDALAPWMESLEITKTVLGPGVAIDSEVARRTIQETCASVEAAALELEAEARAQERIEEEQRSRSRFMSAMGHELRSPLNSIVGFAQMLEEGADGPLAPGPRESVVMVRRSAQELLRLLTDILDSARLEAGRLQLRRAWTPAVEITTESVHLGRNIIEGQAVEIDTLVQPGLPPVYVDRARIVQAVVAAFRHAARNKTDGVLQLRATTGRAPDGRASLLVEVRDSARALHPDELERVFDAFGALRDTSSGQRRGGLGMALSLARNLVRLHGGEVWAESRAPEGTRYVVAVPLATSMAEARGGRLVSAVSVKSSNTRRS